MRRGRHADVTRMNVEPPIARTRRALFPGAPVDAPVELVPPPDVAWSPRRWSILVGIAFTPAMLLALEGVLSFPLYHLVMLVGSERIAGQLLLGWIVVAALLGACGAVAWAILVAANGWRLGDGPRIRWDDWARDRGLERTSVEAIARFDVPMLSCTRVGRQTGIRGWRNRLPGLPFTRCMATRHVFVGDLGEPGERVVAGAMRWVRTPSDDEWARTIRGCFAAVELPEEVEEAFPASRLVRLVRSLRSPAGEAELSWSARDLSFESTDLHETARIEVTGGDDIGWRRLFDTTLVAALAHDLDVEFQQRGRWLVVVAPARDWWRPSARSARMDTLCAAARMLERRFTQEAITMSIANRHKAAADRATRHATRVDRHVSRERARDLEMGPEQLFAELARFTSAEEVESVRAKVDSGEFPLDWLDDLVHHRRAAFWRGNAA